MRKPIYAILLLLFFAGGSIFLSGMVQYLFDLVKYTVVSDDPAVGVDLNGKLYQVEFGSLKVAVDRSGDQPHFYVYTHEEDTQIGQYIAIASGDFQINDRRDNPYFDGVIGPKDLAQYISEEKHFSNASDYQVNYHLLRPGRGEISEFTNGSDGKYTRAIRRWKCRTFGSSTSCGTVKYAFTDISEIVSLYGKKLIAHYDEKKKLVILSISSS